jgi:hypothetical protein
VTKYRLIYAGLALAMVALIAATWALSGDGRRPSLPTPVEQVSPAPDATVLRQASIVVDMVSGYAVSISVDGIDIPPSELTASEALGRYEWEPGPGKAFDTWSPGRHEVIVSWDTITGLPDLGSFTWGFRVQ